MVIPGILIMMAALALSFLLVCPEAMRICVAKCRRILLAAECHAYAMERAQAAYAYARGKFMEGRNNA